MTLENNKHICRNENSLSDDNFLARQASFGPLGLISDPHTCIYFQNSQIGLNIHRGPENMISL